MKGIFIYSFTLIILIATGCKGCHHCVCEGVHSYSVKKAGNHLKYPVLGIGRKAPKP